MAGSEREGEMGWEKEEGMRGGDERVGQRWRVAGEKLKGAAAK